MSVFAVSSWFAIAEFKSVHCLAPRCFSGEKTQIKLCRLSFGFRSVLFTNGTSAHLATILVIIQATIAASAMEPYAISAIWNFWNTFIWKLAKFGYIKVNLRWPNARANADAETKISSSMMFVTIYTNATTMKRNEYKGRHETRTINNKPKLGHPATRNVKRSTKIRLQLFVAT